MAWWNRIKEAFRNIAGMQRDFYTGSSRSSQPSSTSQSQNSTWQRYKPKSSRRISRGRETDTTRESQARAESLGLGTVREEAGQEAVGQEALTAESTAAKIGKFLLGLQTAPLTPVGESLSKAERVVENPLREIGKSAVEAAFIAGTMGATSWLGGARSVSTSTAASKLTSGGISNLYYSVGTGGTVTSATGATINTATVAATGGILAKVFTPKVMAIAGAWAGAVFLGLWGKAEGKEPIEFISNKFLIPNAMKTDDWTLVDEADAAVDELLDLEWWEEVALWSPLSPAVGIPIKIKGALDAVNLRKKLVADLKLQETPDEFYTRIRQEEIDQEIKIGEIHNESRKQFAQWERDFNKQADKEDRALQKKRMREDAEFWRQQRELDYQREAEDREATAKFWMEYRKRIMELEMANSPSQLNFGLF